MDFEKWQALGNDYVILETESLPWKLSAERVKRICDPHFGVGSDGVLLLRRLDEGEAVAELRIFNPDVSFFRVEGGRVRARIFGRGAGETLSSGTGASGAAVAAYLSGTPSPITVVLDGGELEVDVAEDLRVRLSGWAEQVCAGELSPE